MSRLRFGIFMAPFHPAGENPTLALQRDLELVEQPVDRPVARVAPRQHGVSSRAQLRALKLSESAVGYRVGHGRLHRVQRGVSTSPRNSTDASSRKHFLALCRAHGLPQPQVNSRVAELEVDFLFRRAPGRAT